MLASDVITRVRRTLNDIGPFFKWNDDELIDCLNETAAEIYRRRPDCVIIAGEDEFSIDPPDEIDDMSDDVAIDSSFRSALVNGICGRAHEKAAPYASIDTAIYFKQKFDAEV